MLEHFNQDTYQLIQEHFPDLSEPSLQKEIVRVGHMMHFPAGSTIMDFGSFIKGVPLVYQGTVKVIRESEDEDKEIFLYYLYSGETCSMSFSCCMNNKRSNIKTIAEEEVRFIAVPIQYVNDWMGKYPSWRNFVMRSYDNRMQEMVKTIDSIAFKKMDDRLIEYLEDKALALNNKTLHVKHQDIAADLNASREAISRLLKRLEKTGVVRLERNKVTLL